MITWEGKFFPGYSIYSTIAMAMSQTFASMTPPFRHSVKRCLFIIWSLHVRRLIQPFQEFFFFFFNNLASFDKNYNAVYIHVQLPEKLADTGSS